MKKIPLKQAAFLSLLMSSQGYAFTDDELNDLYTAYQQFHDITTDANDEVNYQNNIYAVYRTVYEAMIAATAQVQDSDSGNPGDVVQDFIEKNTGNGLTKTDLGDGKNKFTFNADSLNQNNTQQDIRNFLSSLSETDQVMITATSNGVNLGNITTQSTLITENTNTNINGGNLGGVIANGNGALSLENVNVNQVTLNGSSPADSVVRMTGGNTNSLVVNTGKVIAQGTSIGVVQLGQTGSSPIQDLPTSNEKTTIANLTNVIIQDLLADNSNIKFESVSITTSKIQNSSVTTEGLTGTNMTLKEVSFKIIYNGTPVTLDYLFSDPSYQYFERSQTNTIAQHTINNYVMGNEQDTMNALIMEPTVQINTQQLTLHNENVFILGYRDADLQGGDQTLTLVNGSRNKNFDHVWQIYIDENGQPDITTLALNDGTALGSTMNLTVDQSDLSKIGLLIRNTGEARTPTVINRQEFVRILTQNPTLTSFLSGLPEGSVTEDSVLSLYGVVSELTAIQNRGNGNEARTIQSANEFRHNIRSALYSKASVDQKVHNIFKALSDSGPVNVGNNEYRVWLLPFATITHLGELKQRDQGYGALVGGEYRDLKRAYTLGLFTGFSTGKTKDQQQDLNTIKRNGFSYGSYASYGAWEGGRIDAIYHHGSINNKRSHVIASSVHEGKYKVKSDTVDVMTSHLFKVPGDIWSVRLNVGHTWASESAPTYTLGTARRIHETHLHSKELYGGIGVRWNNRGEKLRLRVTGVYEYGYEYVHKGSSPDTTFLGRQPIMLKGRTTNEKNRNHYITVNASVLDQLGWKFITSYSGIYSKKDQSHSLTLKAEYRF